VKHPARNAPAILPSTPNTWPPKHVESQLLLALEGLQGVRAGPSWEALPNASRAQVVVLLARLLARTGLGVEDNGV